MLIMARPLLLAKKELHGWVRARGARDCESESQPFSFT